MIPQTAETGWPSPKPELERRVNVDDASRGSSLSSRTFTGTARKENDGRREEMGQGSEQEVFSEEGGKFRTLSWWYGKLHNAKLFYGWC